MSNPYATVFSMFEFAVRSIQLVRFSELSSSTIIVYEHLITLEDEIQLIWKASWSAPKILFLINRYYTLFIVGFNNYVLFSSHLSDGFCQGWFIWQGWTGLFSCAVAELILQLRLYALYFRSKKILILMGSSFAVAMAASASIMGLVLGKIDSHAHLIPGTPFCVPENVSKHFYTFWIPVLAFETLLCTLAVVRVYETYRTQEMQRGMHLVEVLLRDSVMYYLVMFATYLTITLIWAFGSNFMLEVPIGFAVAMSCVMGNRLLLNLRGTSTNAANAARGAALNVYGSEGCGYGYGYGGYGPGLGVTIMREYESKVDGAGVNDGMRVVDEESLATEGDEMGKRVPRDFDDSPGSSARVSFVEMITSSRRPHGASRHGVSPVRAVIRRPQTAPTKSTTHETPTLTRLQLHQQQHQPRPLSPPLSVKSNAPSEPDDLALSPQPQSQNYTEGHSKSSRSKTLGRRRSLTPSIPLTRNGSSGSGGLMAQSTRSEVRYDTSNGSVIGEYEMETLRRMRS